MTPCQRRRSNLLVAFLMSAGAAGLFLSTGLGAQNLIDRTQLLADLRILSSDEMQGRRIGTAGGMKARAYVVERFRAAGLEPVGAGFEHPFDVPRLGSRDRSAASGVNVAGQLRGAGTAPAYLVVSAHYDHVGVQNGEVFNGADDNASGTAALFAIASYFAKKPPSGALLFVAFDGEEEGLLGSRAFVAAPPVARDALLFDLNLDMIGRDPDDILWVSGVRSLPSLKPLIETVASRAPVKLRMGYDDPAGDDWTQQSDQLSFNRAGIPALYVGVSDFANHHQPQDDFETITYDFYVKAVQTSIMLIESLDGHRDALRALREPAARRTAR